MSKINLDGLSEVYLEVARELGMSKFLVEDTIKHFYGEVRHNLSNPKYGSILIHHLGKFKVNQGALRHILRERTTLKEDMESYNNLINLLKDKYKDEFTKVEESESSDGNTSLEQGSN